MSVEPWPFTSEQLLAMSATLQQRTGDEAKSRAWSKRLGSDTAAACRRRAAEIVTAAHADGRLDHLAKELELRSYLSGHDLRRILDPERQEPP